MSESQEKHLAKPSIAPPWVQDAVQIIELFPPPVKETIAVFRRSLENATKGVHIEELQTTEQKKWQIEERDDGTAQIHLNTKRRIHNAFKPVILQLDEEFVNAFNRRFDEVEAEWNVQRTSMEYWTRLIKLLHEHIGDEALDVSSALAVRIVAEGGGWDADDEVPKVADLEERNKKNGIQGILEKCSDLIEEGDAAFLQEIFGERHFKRLHDRFYGDVGSIVWHLWAICSRSERVRNTLLRLLEDTLRSSEKLLIGASVRQGWKHLLEAREVKGLPRAKKVRTVMDNLEKTILTKRLATDVTTNITGYEIHEVSAESNNKIPERSGDQDNDADFDDDELRELELQLRGANALWSEYALDGFEPTTIRSLTDALDWRKWRRHLSRAAYEGDHFRLAMLYKQIAHAVFHEVAEYDVFGKVSSVTGITEGDECVPAYIRGRPVHVVEHQQTSCFSGVWLMAALLAKCGIPLKDMLFSLVHQHHDGLIGSHGQLLLLTPWKEILTMDHGFHICGREFKIHFCLTNEMEAQMEALISGESSEPAVVQVKNNFAEALGYPRAMVVMPVLDGIASRHMLHVGIEFLEQGRLHEAQKAMQLSLDFARRKNPDAFFYLGIMHAQNGNTAHAKICLEQALKVFPLHVRSLHALAKIALMEGNPEEARKWFVRVVAVSDPVWGDQDFLHEAQEYISQHPIEKKEDSNALTYDI